MLDNIFGILDKLGFGTQKRAISAQFSNSQLNSQIMLQRIDGYHGINEGLSAELICLSTNPFIELKQFIGSQVAVDQVTDSGQLFRTTGIITGASQGQSDGALSLYRLTMQDSTSLWHKRRNSRVFMNKSVVEICEIIFKEWQSKSSLFASSLKLDTSSLTKTYDIRPFSMQSNESDYTYLTRILREESINWLIDESDYIVSNNNKSIAPQKLRLVDDNAQFKAIERRNIRYHRSNAVEKYDSITSFIAQRSLQPTAIHVQRWQADQLSQEDGCGSVLSKHKHSSNRDNENLSLEQAWSVSPAWISDLKGEDQATKSGNSQLEKLNTQLNQYQALQAKYFTAQSSVRDTQVGYWFQLVDHPELEKNHSSNDREFLILNKHFYNQNNLPKDMRDQLEKLLILSHWDTSKDSDQERQANELMVVRRSIAVVPEYDPLMHRPVAHVQRAKVTTDGEEIHVDEWGRIKVRFLFTRTDDHSHDGGAGSNDNDTDSAWVDVLTPWAGEGYGARFLPRKDEIVVIDFFDGNIDRPFVTGRIHEAQRNPTKFDIKGQLPDTKKLSGIRSKEVDGEGFNQLRFDDTTGQISTQLHSSHGATQLNLGNLSHPKEKAESDGRGEGFELRTDQWGALRAAKGLLISTRGQNLAEKCILNFSQVIKDLHNSLEALQTISENAKYHHAEGMKAIEDIEQWLNGFTQDEKNKKTPISKYGQPFIFLESVDHIGVSSQKSIVMQAKHHISLNSIKNAELCANEEINISAAEKVSIFAHKLGMKLISVMEKIEIQSQANNIEIAADKLVNISSVSSDINIQAKGNITIQTGNSSIKLTPSNITLETSGKIDYKAGQHCFTSGSPSSKGLPTFTVKDLEVDHKGDFWFSG